MSNNHLNTENQPQAQVFKWGAATHVGNVRTSNQDKYGIASNLLAVADGMGGHNGGEVAAEIAVNALTAANDFQSINEFAYLCLLYTSPSPRDGLLSRMPSSA